MNKRDEFLKIQKILRLSTIDKSNFPHITPVWYMFNDEKIYIGTNTKNQKIKNIEIASSNKFSSYICANLRVDHPVGMVKIVVEGNWSKW